MPQSGNFGHLTVTAMDKMPPGSRVIDGCSDISRKRPDGLWESFETAPLTSAKLHKYGPIRVWVGPYIRASVRTSIRQRQQ